MGDIEDFLICLVELFLVLLSCLRFFYPIPFLPSLYDSCQICPMVWSLSLPFHAFSPLSFIGIFTNKCLLFLFLCQYLLFGRLQLKMSKDRASKFMKKNMTEMKKKCIWQNIYSFKVYIKYLPSPIIYRSIEWVLIHL